MSSNASAMSPRETSAVMAGGIFIVLKNSGPRMDTIISTTTKRKDPDFNPCQTKTGTEMASIAAEVRKLEEM